MKLTHKILKIFNDKTGYDPHPPLEEPKRPPQLVNSSNRVVVVQSSFTETRSPNASDYEAIKQHLAKELGMALYQNGSISFERKVEEENGNIKITARIAAVEEYR